MTSSHRPPGNPFPPDPLPPGGSEDFLGLGAELGLNAPPGLQPRHNPARPAAQGPTAGQQVQTGFFPPPGYPQPGHPQPGDPQAGGLQPQPGLFAAPARPQPPPLTQTGHTYTPQRSQRPPVPPPLPPPLPSQKPSGWRPQAPPAQTGFHAPLPSPPVHPAAPPPERRPQPFLGQTGFHAPLPAQRPPPPQHLPPSSGWSPPPQEQAGFLGPQPAQRPIPPPQQPFPPSWNVRPTLGQTGFHAPPPAPGPAAPAPRPPAPRAPAAPPFRPTAPAAMPPQELLPQNHALAPSWPDVRPNNWRVSAPPAHAPRASEPADRPSWLLELADGAAPPAHPSFVPRAAPSNASFHDGSVPAEHVAPWFVRGLAILAGLFLCAVITKTLLLGGSKRPEVPSAPVQPAEGARTAAPVELLTPAEADRKTRSQPANAKRRGSAAAQKPEAGQQGAVLEAPPEPEAPALVVYALPPAPPAQVADVAALVASHAGGASGPSDDAVRERVERWLAQQSRASSPLADLGAFRAVAPPPAGDRPVPAASTDAGAAVAAVAGHSSPGAGMTGIWEGTTVPIEALDGTLRLETPSVGRVRVRLEGAQREEGRLTAIGQGRVWLTTGAGPIQVESSRLRGLEQIAEVEGQKPAAGPGSARQRVRTPGGVFYGTVLSREGRSVTLVTDAGARLTVDADEISAAESAAARPARP